MSILKSIATLSLLVLLPALGCDAEPMPRGGSGDRAGGKADAIDADDADDLSCPADVYVRHSVNDRTNHIYSNCHDAETGRFITKPCCGDELDFVEDVSGCPAQVEFNDVPGSGKRCINDTNGHPQKGQFVATACCAALCDEGAWFDEGGVCRTGTGQFEEPICCIRADNLVANNCVGAQWEHVEGGARDFACRAPNGQFTFDACCIDQCAETISRTGQVPESCSFDDLTVDECPAGSTPNSGGICHNPDNGQFVKAACCELLGETEDLDTEKSDDCWLGLQQSC
jgi:hypothetical protein